MSKTLIAALMLSLPLLAMAEGPKNGHKTAKKPAAAASAPAAPASAATPSPSASRMSTAAALQRNQSRGAAMGACSKQAADQKLADVERKQFIAACMNAK